MTPTWTLLAADAPAPAPAAEAARHPLVQFVMDNPFLLAVVFVFLVALVGAFIAARKRDRCLKRFRGYPVTLLEQAGRTIWGRLRVFPKGVELLFDGGGDEALPESGPATDRAAPDDEAAGPPKHSFLIYEGDLGKLLAAHRFVDRLDDDTARRRARQVRRLARPGPLARLARMLRNVVNTLRDAFVQAFSMSVQQASKTTANPVLQAQGGQVNAIGSMLIGETANAYEPMLEQYIGDPVVLELVSPADPEKRVVEYHGYLGEYSAQFLLLVDVRRRFQEKAPLAGGQTTRLLEGTVIVQARTGEVVVENHAAVEVTLEGLHRGAVCTVVNRTIAPGETAAVPFPNAAEATAAPAEDAEGSDAEGLVAALSVTRQFDLIVPRACGLVRHASAAATEA